MRERSTIEGLERGVRGTKKTLERMHKLVALGKLDPTMQRIATWIRLQVPKDQRANTTAVLDRIFWWVKRHGIFQRDPFQIEKIEHPIAAMQPIIEARRAGTYRGRGLFVGDCDTVAGVYLATLGGILGFHYAWETAKVDLERPDEFSHVWVAFRTNGDWYPLDPSTASARPGWRPPVAPELFARWPEKPIEDTLEGSMSGLNGFHRNGLGDEASADEGYYPEEEYGYGIPKSFGPDGAEGLIPVSDAANIQLLPPHDTEIPRADLQSDLRYIKASKGKNPSRRIWHLKGQPDSHGPPYYRKPGARQEYIKVERQPYPPGSPWNRNLGRDVRRFRKAGPWIQGQEPGTPERQVRIVMEQPMALRRRQVTVVTRAKRLPSGMGQMPLVSVTPTTDVAKTAETASKDVWGTITDTIKAALPAATDLAIKRTEARYAEKLSKATNTVAGAPVVTPKTYTEKPTSIFSSPWFWIGTGVTALGAGYVLMKSRGGRRR